jgi:hypothetical protein
MIIAKIKKTKIGIIQAIIVNSPKIARAKAPAMTRL